MAFSTHPSVSIIILAYNEALYIRDCIEAVLAQTEQPIEIIIVDNNSTDDTVKIASEYPLVKIVTEPKQGVVHARTTGFNSSKGDILAKIDADTIVEPHWLETMKKQFVADPQLNAASGHFSNREQTAGFMKGISLAVSNAYIFKLQPSFGLYKMIFGSNLWIRKKDWDTIKSSMSDDDRIWEDLDVALKLSMHGINKTHIEKNVLYAISARRIRQSTKDAVLYGLGGFYALWPHSKWRASLLALMTTSGALLSIIVKITMSLSNVALQPFGQDLDQS